MKTIIEAHKIAAEVADIEVPWKVWTAFFETKKNVHVTGHDVCLGNGDYKTISEAREAIAWYVEQLGGKVKWSKK